MSKDADKRILFIFCFLFCGCGQTLRSTSSLVKEEFDRDNDPSLLGIPLLNYEDITAGTALKGALRERPWGDSYWPYYKKGIASRYVTGADFQSFADQTRDATSNPTSHLLSPAEKYDRLGGDSEFRLTKESWDAFQNFSQIYGRDARSWSWMGICSGWAPAAISEKKPINPVLASRRGSEPVLFFDGDIRALLSKVYDLNSTTGGFAYVGSRCEISAGAWVRDQYGRIVDGVITNTGEMFTIVNDHAQSRGVLEVKKAGIEFPSDSYFLASDKPFEHLGGEQWAFRYPNREDLAQDLRDRTLGSRAVPNQPFYLRLQKNCRDVNPASLHSALVHFLSDRNTAKSSFVLEISRGREVWNHPVWGFRSYIEVPRSVREEPMARRVLHAPLTTHVARVKTDIFYASGLQPYPFYAPEPPLPVDLDREVPENTPMLRLDYDLEFDAAGFIIGGEWRDTEGVNSEMPDFFWRPIGAITDANKDHTGPSVLKYSTIKTLLECSRKTPNDSVHIPLTQGITDLPVVRCLLP